MNGSRVITLMTSVLAALLIAAISGAVVVYGRVNALETDNGSIRSRLDRIEGKLDRLIERL